MMKKQNRVNAFKASALALCAVAALAALWLGMSVLGGFTALKAKAETQKDTRLVETYTPSVAPVCPQTVVCDVKDSTVLESVVGDVRPSNAILRFDARKNAVGANGETLGSFIDVYGKLNKKVIPIAYVNDDASADALIDFLSNTLDILDMAVMSDKAALVAKVRKAKPSLRGIIEYKNLPENLYTAVKESTEACASVVVLSSKDADVKNVTYLQARFKSVWVRSDSETFGNFLTCIASGALGVIASDFKYVYDAFSFTDGYTRNIFNVAHRGLPSKYNENSLGGIEAAMRAGVTHLELDGHLTKDKHIVINHDDTVDRETNGSGVIADLTLAQIKSFDLDLKTPHEKMPTLEECIDLIERLNAELGSDVVLVFEIKDDQTDFVENMKRVLDEKDFYDSIVVITFERNEKQLMRLKETVPQIPTATLDAVSQGSFKNDLPTLNAKNTGVDLIQVLRNDVYERMLVDRGFAGWYWTFGAPNDVKTASLSGVLGVTNNAADCFKDGVRYVYADAVENATASDVPDIGDSITLKAVLYDGTEKNVFGEVYYTEKTAQGWECFAKYVERVGESSRTVYTQGIRYLAPVKTPDAQKPFPVGATVGLIAAAVAVIAAAVAAALILLKKRKKA